MHPYEDVQHRFLLNILHRQPGRTLELDRRQEINAASKRAILQELQRLLYYALTRLFKNALERMPNDDYIFVIWADKRPSGTHERTFNAPIIDEVDILIVGENLKTATLLDTLQYPPMFRQLGTLFTTWLKELECKKHCGQRAKIIDNHEFY